jgi:hypothetical protein
MRTRTFSLRRLGSTYRSLIVGDVSLAVCEELTELTEAEILAL